MQSTRILLSSVLALTGSWAIAQDVNVDQAISQWPQGQQQTVQQMIDKYGQPSGVTQSRVVWSSPDSPWEEIVINKKPVDHDFPMPHQDYLEQAIYLEVPPDKMDELAEFDGSVIVYRTEGRVAARCDKEAANYLALNLAHDIITEDKSVEQARQEYADAVRQMQWGETPEIMQRLTFEPMSQQEAAASDVALIEGSGSGSQDR